MVFTALCALVASFLKAARGVRMFGFMHVPSHLAIPPVHRVCLDIRQIGAVGALHYMSALIEAAASNV